MSAHGEPTGQVSGRATTERLRLVRAGVDTYQEPVVYMRADCAICRSEGLEAQARVYVEIGARGLIATVNVVTNGGWLPSGVAALSDAAWRRLKPQPDELASFRHADPPESARLIRAKVYGERLGRDAYRDIMRDAVEGQLSDLELAAFLTACAARRMETVEVTELTQAMVDVGERLVWPAGPIFDKHCVGGLPGNRTTPIVVAIVAACGYIIPKTSSRAITSPSGTADTMATLAPVDLDLATMRRVVEREGGCIAWGGSVGLSPADDVLIRVERPLDFDSEPQLIASVLSKKLAVGSTHVLLDLPVGATAKIRSAEAAQALGLRLTAVGEALGLRIALQVSDGNEPVGSGIGPALEARNVLAVLRRSPNAPQDLRERALDLAGRLLELAGVAPGRGREKATRVLDDGTAERKFEAICAAQGGRREPPVAAYRAPIVASEDGIVRSIDNRVLGRIAKLAGAPRSPAAGLELHVRRGDAVTPGSVLMTVHAESPGELAYALNYHAQHPQAIGIQR
jgi:thymidine phosphorylase